MNRQPAKRFQVLTVGFIESYHQVELSLAYEHFGNNSSIHGRFNKVGDVATGQAILLQLVPFNLDTHLWDGHLRFDL